MAEDPSSNRALSKLPCCLGKENVKLCPEPFQGPSRVAPKDERPVVHQGLLHGQQPHTPLQSENSSQREIASQFRKSDNELGIHNSASTERHHHGNYGSGEEHDSDSKDFENEYGKPSTAKRARQLNGNMGQATGGVKRRNRYGDMSATDDSKQVNGNIYKSEDFRELLHGGSGRNR